MTDGVPWYRKMWGTIERGATEPEVAERLRKLELALEIRSVTAPIASADRDQAAAAADLLKSLESVPSAVIQLGSLLIIKHVVEDGPPLVIVRTLTSAEMVRIQHSDEYAQTFFGHALAAVSGIAFSPVDSRPSGLPVAG